MIKNSIFIILAIIAVVLGGSLIMAFLGMLLTVFIACWAIGMPIKVTFAGNRHGHIKWFTFYPARE